ncbi:hypothetical protein LUR56_39770 [Streptomyces sp. MT29]|nr:hypothetical protein [Streptomyces sp. MT29]
MLKPASPAQLAALADRLGAGYAASYELVREAVLRTEVRQADDGAFGRYCRDVLPPILQRAVAAETALAALRTVVARHVAAADLGEDPAPGDLLDAAFRAGMNLREEVVEATEVLEAETRHAAFL